MLLDENEFLRLWKRYQRMKSQTRLKDLYDILQPTMKYTFRHYVMKSYYNDLFQEMYLLLPSMLDNWHPGKGKAYNYFHTSFSNRGRTYAKKERNINSYGKNPLVDPEILETTVDESFSVEEIAHNNRVKEALSHIEPRISKEYFWFCLDRLEYPTQKIITELVRLYKINHKKAKFYVEYSRTIARLTLQSTGLIDDLPVSYESLLRNNRDSVVPELYLLIGHELFIDLMRVYGGVTVSLPTVEQLHKQDIEGKVLVELKRGTKRVDIEQRYGVNSYFINRCLKSLRRRPR